MNEFYIGAQDERIVIMRPIPHVLTRERAVALAAWLVAIADPSREAFDAKLREISES